jgi:hypothetical protein
VATITMSGSLRTDGKNALGPGLSKIKMAASLPQSVIAVGATDVDPSRSVGRPRPAPAAVVGSISVGHTNTNERKAMVAVMEESAVTGKSCMRKTRTSEAATCEPDPAAREADAAACETHAAGTHAATHATRMHSTSMHAATTMTATAATMAATATATATASEHG